MSDEQPFAIQAALRRHFEREVHSPLGVTLSQLLRTDAGRLQFFDPNRIVESFEIQRRYVVGDVERIVIEAAQWDPTLSAAIGFELEDLQVRPEPSAWLVTADGDVIDPARSRRPVLGFLGIVLRNGEASNWTPELPHQVAVGDAQRLIVR